MLRPLFIFGGFKRSEFKLRLKRPLRFGLRQFKCFGAADFARF